MDKSEKMKRLEVERQKLFNTCYEAAWILCLTAFTFVLMSLTLGDLAETLKPKDGYLFELVAVYFLKGFSLGLALGNCWYAADFATSAYKLWRAKR